MKDADSLRSKDIYVSVKTPNLSKTDFCSNFNIDHNTLPVTMSGTFAGKVAIITGGTKGIGLSTAKLFISLGAKVVVSYSGDAKAAEDFMQTVGAENGTAVKADSADLQGIDLLIKTTVEKYNKIDILVLNAGILQSLEVEQVTEEAFTKSFNVNVKGPMFTVQKALPYIPAGGKIIFVSTTQNFASTVTPPYFLYCATKGAVDQMTRTLAKDLARRDINVNCVAPGPTGTYLFKEGRSEEVLRQIATLNPFNRIGEPEEVAGAFAFLSGPDSKWVNGQILKVNGGQYVG